MFGVKYSYFKQFVFVTKMLLSGGEKIRYMSQIAYLLWILSCLINDAKQQ
jgi:hypothetical protein